MKITLKKTLRTIYFVCTDNDIIAPSNIRHIDPAMNDTKGLQKLKNVFSKLAFLAYLSPKWEFPF